MAASTHSTPAAADNYKAESLGHSMLLAMGKMRDADVYTDIKLLLDDNTCISAHRVVLASYSKYFEALFSPNMQEGNQQEPVKLYDVDKTSIVALVDFAYTSEIEITMENVHCLLETANYLGVVPAIEACVNFLKKHMDNSNCLSILTSADVLGLVDLRDEAMNYAVFKYNDIRKQEEFVHLPYDLFSLLLQQETIVITTANVVATSAQQECVILQSVFEYVSKNNSLSNEKALNLFRKVRVGIISPERLQEIQSQYKNVLDANSDVEKWFRDDRSEKGKKPRKFPKRCDKMGESVILANGYVTPIVRRFNHCNAEHWLIPGDYICGMDLSIRTWIGARVLGGLTVYYSNGYRATHGNFDASNELHTFKLNSDERIVKVDASSGQMVDKLTFTANTGRQFGPFGGSGGGYQNCTPHRDLYPILSRVEGAEVHTYGAIGITELKFYFTVYQLTGNHENLQ